MTKDIVKFYGPYIRKDNGRSQLVAIYNDGTKGSMSYPKFLIEKLIDRKLEPWETVDHRNDNPRDDSIFNLQVLSRKENILKHAKKKPAKYHSFICPECGRQSKRLLSQVKHNLNQGKDGPFCSRSCASVHNARKQYSALYLNG